MPETTIIDLSAVGPALWGANWQSQMATEFNIGDRNIRRWISDPEDMPEGVAMELRGLISRRLRMMQERMKILGRAVHSSELAGDTFGNFAEGDAAVSISDGAIRARCVQAAARAMMRGPAQNETAAIFAGFVMGLGNNFYALAKSNPATALMAIDAAAEAMVNAKGPSQPTQAFGNDVATVAEQFYLFASGQQASRPASAK